MPEPLEPRAAPGGGILEILLGAPLLDPFLGSFWADSNPLGSDELPGITYRSQKRLSALAALGQDSEALHTILGETRRLLDISRVDNALADLYVDATRTRLHEVADALSDPGSGDLHSREFSRSLWWVDELFTSLAFARGLGSDALGAEGMDFGGWWPPFNMPPIATDEWLPYLVHDRPFSLPAPGAVGNDTDDGLIQPLSAYPDEGYTAQGGTYSIEASGAFTYMPPELWTGTDWFNYQITDGQYTDWGTVRMLVNNHAPVANADGPYYTLCDIPVTKAAPGVLANDTDADGDDRTAVRDTLPSHGTLEYFNPDGSFRYLPAGGYVGQDSFTYKAFDGLAYSQPAMVTILVYPRIDLDAKMILHNAAIGDLPDEVEDYPGAFVPLNNDDDNYDLLNAADKDQPGAIVGESDLLPIVLHPIQPVSQGGWYDLHVPANVRVWEHADRTVEVVDLTTFGATTETTLYVEGVQTGAGIVYVDWWKDQQRINAADTVAVTVFEWQGPLNVPGYSRYLYRATGGRAGMGNSMWLAPGGGSIWSSEEHDTTPDEAVILWGKGGDAVGKAVYQADPNYVWDLEVNVVDIDLDVANSNGTAYPEPYQRDGAGTNWIEASDDPDDNAMTAYLFLNTVEGPTVNGSQRGRKFMELGLSQRAQVWAQHGNYNDLTPPKRGRNSLEDGTVHWDSLNQSLIPWVRATEYSHLIITADDQNVDAYRFALHDNPSAEVVNHFVYAGDQVDYFALRIEFWDYFIVASNDPRVIGSDDHYTERAILHWTFDGSGTIDAAGVWHEVAGTGVAVDPRFNGIFNGEPLPDAATNLNEAWAASTWYWENQ